MADAVDVEVDVSTLESGEDRRDNRIRTQGLESRPVPDGHLHQHRAGGAARAGTEAGQAVKADVTGDLTIHGVTKQVTIPLDVRLTGGQGEVVGSLKFPFSDFGMSPPEHRRVRHRRVRRHPRVQAPPRPRLTPQWCPSCRREWPAGTAACRECFVELVEEEALSAIARCRHCGRDWPARMQACPDCLAELRLDPQRAADMLAVTLAQGFYPSRPAGSVPFATGSPAPCCGPGPTPR